MFSLSLIHDVICFGERIFNSNFTMHTRSISFSIILRGFHELTFKIFQFHSMRKNFPPSISINDWVHTQTLMTLFTQTIESYLLTWHIAYCWRIVCLTLTMLEWMYRVIIWWSADQSRRSLKTIVNSYLSGNSQGEQPKFPVKCWHGHTRNT